MKPYDQDIINKISQHYNLTFVVLFGSVARGDRRDEESDLDIAVLTKEKPTVNVFKNLFSGFSDAFPGENVDVRFLNDADMIFRYQVVRDGKLLYGDIKAYEKYKLLTIKIYIDDGRKFFPFQEQLLLEQQKRLEQFL